MKRYIRTAVTNVSDEDIYSRREIASKTDDVYLLRQLSEDNDPSVRASVARNQHTPIDILLKLTEDPIIPVRENLMMRDEVLPLEVQMALASNTPGLRKLLLQYEDVDTEIINLLSNDENDIVREMAAIKPRLSDENKIRLSNDKDKYVRYELAKNRRLPLDIVVKLSTDDYDAVRIVIAGRQDTPAEILDKMSYDDFENVRSMVAYNKNTPITTLKRLLKDKSERVQSFARDNLEQRGQ